MKLYYLPGACSLASHIALNEVGADFTIEKVDTKAGTTETGQDYKAINPNGYVPALALDADTILLEGPAILQHIADNNPAVKLAPPAGTVERARVNQYLTFTGSELHAAFRPFFANPNIAGPEKDAAQQTLFRRFAYFENELSDGREFLVGDTFTVADSYLFVVSNWANHLGFDLNQWPNLAAFVGRIASRPAVQKALAAEGLLENAA